ncbi:metallophosphoesterase [Candidatus Sumerlaeota bacterium]|nr:metallophosphoesterase [Candidatus Sumerlaeota bacterium]
MSRTIKIAHIGDLHFWHLPRNPFVLLNKRVLGVGNLIVGGRARRFRQELAPQLVARLNDSSFHAHLFSGDFSTTSLHHEFGKAFDHFSSIPDTIGFYSVPGNHDCYITSELSAPTFSRGLTDRFNPETAISLVELAPQLGLLRINATTSNGLSAHGRITEQHLAFLSQHQETIIRDLKQLIVLCHFPPEDPSGVLRHDRGPQLLNARPFIETLSPLPMPVLWLHGHHHYRWLFGSPTAPNLTYLNGGAPLMRFGGRAPDLGFHEVEFSPDAPVLVRTHYTGAHHKDWKVVENRLPKSGEFIDLQKLHQ